SQFDRAVDRVGIVGRGAKPGTPPMGLRIHLDSDPLLFEEDRGRPRGLIGVDLDLSSGDAEYRHHNLQNRLTAGADDDAATLLRYRRLVHGSRFPRGALAL